MQTYKKFFRRVLWSASSSNTVHDGYSVRGRKNNQVRIRTLAIAWYNLWQEQTGASPRLREWPFHLSENFLLRGTS